MWVKRDHNETLQEHFCEAIQVEKDMFYLKDNPDTSSEQVSTSCKKIDNFPKPTAMNQYPFKLNDMKKLLQKMSNEMVDIKKNNNENQANNRGFSRPHFRWPNQPPQNPPPPNPGEGFTSKEIFSILKALAAGTQDTPESSDDQTNQDSQPPQEEEE